MRFILDTHIFLWFINDDPKSSDSLKELIENENNNRFLVTVQGYTFGYRIECPP